MVYLNNLRKLIATQWRSMTVQEQKELAAWLMLRKVVKKEIADDVEDDDRHALPEPPVAARASIAGALNYAISITWQDNPVFICAGGLAILYNFVREVVFVLNWAFS